MASDQLHSQQVSMQIRRARDMAQRSEELLSQPKPDTFAGRKTREPFPAEDPMLREDIQNLIHSELQPPKE
ncbi:hypothetical protein [Bradyrhizobium sp. CCBAU 65884]|uniref:hypothetical protein n=1 Tax=Bradyrhizobium sp. CCBAU 65884 TaxID=722477 RepID=UPI002306BC41|nr:hypothetical protein [Bradyrhizobium sp. CCBAU 65884]